MSQAVRKYKCTNVVGHYERDSNAIPFQYEENSCWKGSILLHLSTNTLNNKMLNNKMTLPFLKQLVLALVFLWWKNVKLLNYRMLVLSNLFKIKHTKPFFRLSNETFCLFVCFLILHIYFRYLCSYSMHWSGETSSQTERKICVHLYLDSMAWICGCFCLPYK